METSVNYNRMTTIFFISGIIVMASLYTALPLPRYSQRFWHFKCCCLTKWCDLSFTYSISCLFYGTISEKFGRIRTILFGLIGLVIICLLIGFIHSFTTYYSSCNSRYMRGSFSPVSITYVTETYSPVKRVTAISFISTSFMLSGVIGQNE